LPSCTEAFLAALRRFIARRGRQRAIHSENDNNLQGAANVLHAVHKMLQSKSQMATIQVYLAAEEREWNFMHPHDSEFGELWIAAVK